MWRFLGVIPPLREFPWFLIHGNLFEGCVLYILRAVSFAHFMSSYTCVCGDNWGHVNLGTQALNTLLQSISTRSRRNRRLKIQENCRNMRKLWALMCRTLRELRAGIEPSGANLAPAPAPAMRKFAGISRAGVRHFRVPKFRPDILSSIDQVKYATVVDLNERRRQLR